MSATAVPAPFCPPQPLTRCVACREPLYAGFPLRTVADGAMHVGCFMLEARPNTGHGRKDKPEAK